MADLSNQHHEMLKSMRDRGLHQPAMKLQGLFEQIRERPGDGQITEMIAGMVKQYIRGHDKLVEPPWRVVEVDSDPAVVIKSPLPEDVMKQLIVEDTKPQLQLVPFDFIEAMAIVLQEGNIPPRKAGDWRDLDAEGLEQKRGALLRHYGKREWAAVAVNAMILWWHDRRTK